MSEELRLFKQRVTDLGVLLESLLQVDFDANTKAELHSAQQKLNLLNSIIKNRGTLNTGGHFEWVDSKIVQALKVGQYICLEHVNLCSSAILDRLNSVFETDGKMLLSEKGVESNNQSESVSKHSDFRAFLTLDPRNGEISRAMRNRCIELSLTADTYSRDDLKELIYLNGIHEMHLIEWTLNIHCRVQQVSEFHTFNVSHLSKFAFLINENLRLGAGEQKALYDSALVVYVRSSHIDLLGMGLNYYHERLIEEIRDEINKIPDKHQNIVNLGNLIIQSNDLNSLTLIRLQCEPLIIAVQCLTSGMDNDQIQSVLSAAREKFSTVPIELDWKSVEYHLHLIYEMSSLNDLTAREQYIHTNITKQLTKTDECHHTHLTDLIALNRTLAESVRQATVNLSSNNSALHSVPWNQHVFPRLREYCDQSPLLTKVDQLKLSAILLANLSFDRVEIDAAKVKQSHINAITYSKAVNAGTIPNGLDIDLITHLHPLLDAIKAFTTQIIWQAQSMDHQQYSTLICAYLWANRLYEVSKSKIFKEKSVDKILIDKLALHFNWLTKHLLNLLNHAVPEETKDFAQFRRIIQKISECNTVRRHPLNEMRKYFTKRFSEFKPFYEQNQITLHEYEREFLKQLQLPTKKWQSFEPAEYLQTLVNKYRIILSNESANYKHYLVENTDAEELRWLSSDCNGNVEDCEQFDDSKILEKLGKLVTSSASVFNNNQDVCTTIQLEDLIEQNEKFSKYLESNDAADCQSHVAPLKLIVSVLPMMEYFALRALNSVFQRNSNIFKLNMNFFKNIRSLDVNVLKSVQTVISKDYRIGEIIWKWAQKTIQNESLDSVLTVMTPTIYRKIASFLKMLESRILHFGYNSLALNHQFMLNSIESNKQFETTSINSCVLTVTTFLSLFNEFGKSKSIGLGNLEVWSSTLTSLSKLLWNNIEIFQDKFQYELTNIEYNVQHGKQLLTEIKYIQSLIEKSDNQKSQIQNEFSELVELLEKKTEFAANTNRFENFYTSAMIQTLSAVLELHLMNFTPLVDPVEKNRLKKSYMQQNQKHLTNLTLAYEFMKVTMSYDGLGKQIVEESLQSKSNEFKQLVDKYSEKCALRPDVCVYAELVDQINFFLENGCRLKSQLQLLNDIDSAYQKLNSGAGGAITQHDIQIVDEIIKRIDWCTNTAESFERSTIARFGTYYRDFTASLEASVIVLKNGLRGMKQCLVKSRELILTSKLTHLDNLSESESLSSLLVNLIEFPNVDRKPHFMSATVRVLESLDSKDIAHSM